MARASRLAGYSLRALLAVIGLAPLAGADAAGLHRWTAQRGTPFDERSQAVAMTAEGDTVVVGGTKGGLDGNINHGFVDVFVMKHSASGVWNWTVQRGSEEMDSATAVAVSAAGDIFVAGSTDGDLDGQSKAGGTESGTDIFLMKVSPLGAWQWTVLRGSPDWDYASSLALSAEGDVYVAGYTYDGDRDVLLLKFSSSGAWQWTQQRGSGHSLEHVDALAVDAEGCALLAGYTHGSLDGGVRAGGSDVFLMKFAPNGTWLWTTQHGSAEDDYAQAVAPDAAGDYFVAGHTRGGLDGSSSAGIYDVFLMKFSSSGTRLWTVQRGSRSSDYAFDLALSAEGDAFVTGYTDGDLDGQRSAGDFDAYLMKFSASGAWQWTQQRGSAQADFAKAVACGAHGQCVITGHTEGDLEQHPNAGGRDVFLMSFATSNATSTSTSVSARTSTSTPRRTSGTAAGPRTSTSTSTSSAPPAAAASAVAEDSKSELLATTMVGAAALLCLSCAMVWAMRRLRKRKADGDATCFARDWWGRSPRAQQQSEGGPRAATVGSPTAGRVLAQV